MSFTLVFEFFSISSGFLYDYWICFTGGIQGQNDTSYKVREVNLSPDDRPWLPVDENDQSNYFVFFRLFKLFL
jgi:hypothetical protein